MKKLLEKISKNKSFIIPWLILGFSIIIFGSGLTYAYFDFVLNSQEESSLKVTGTDFDLSLYGTPVEFQDIYPIYDEYIEDQSQEFTFSIENNSRRLASCYSLSITINNISDGLKSSDLKWKLINATTGGTVATGDFSTAGTSEIGLLDNTSISAHTTDSYKLQIWLSYSSTTNQNDMQSTYFYGNIKLVGSSASCQQRTNAKLDNVRYIKSCVNGSTLSVNNHWVELQAIYNGTNVAYGKTPTGTTSENPTYPYSRITDGDTTTTNYAQAGTSGFQCITIDLTQSYDLDEIALWRYYGDARTYYSNNTYVSSDNSTWIPVLVDSTAESSQGKKVTAYDTNATITPIYRLSNLVLNGSFENGGTNWNLSANVAASSVQKKFGSYAIRNYQGAAWSAAYSGSYITAYANHKYYVSAWSYTVNKGNGTCRNYYDIYYSSADHWVNFQNQANLSLWERGSALFTVPSVSTPTLALALADTDSSNATQDCYADGGILIDLTATFGSGNEPTQTWCDANLDYFDGSQNMYLTP